MNQRPKNMTIWPRSARPFCRFEARGSCLNPNCFFRHKSFLRVQNSSPEIRVDEQEQSKLNEVLYEPDYFNAGGKENWPPRTYITTRYKKVNNAKKEKLNKRKRELESAIAELKVKEALITERKSKRAKIYEKVDITVENWMKIIDNVPVVEKE